MNRYEQHLIRVYLQAETDIINEIARLREQGLIDYHAVAALERVQKILRQLKAQNWEYVPKMIEREFYVSHPEARIIPYLGGTEPVEKHIQGYANALRLTSAQTHTVELLTRQLMVELDDACDYVQNNLQNILLGPQNEYRQAAVSAVRRQEASSLQTARKEFLDTLARDGVSCFEDKMGREWRLSSYGAMVIRTTAAQAQTLSILTQNETWDLYQISTIGSTCPVCAPLEGRVYSKSGNDPDFPPLAEAYGLIDPSGPVTLDNTWLCIHPCCLHSLHRYTLEGKTPEEIERIKRFSSFTTNPRENDPRTDAQIKAYRDHIKAREKFDRDYKQWERYRERIPDLVPKTFATFMKHKTLQDDKYKAWMAAYRAAAA